MKARVKATGEIVDVDQCSILYEDGKRELMHGKELEEVQGAPDYWEKLKHQYAGKFLQGMIIGKPFTRDYVEDAYKYATTLVNRLKEEEK